jgi:hypothetical protein
VLAEIDRLRVDAIAVGGDVASGPMPVETLDALRGCEAYFVRGNADRVLDLGEADDGELWVQGGGGSPSASGRSGCRSSRSCHST